VGKGWVWGFGGVMGGGFVSSEVARGFSSGFRGVNRMVKILAI